MTLVTLTVVHDEMEAEGLCGLLRVNGIECMHRGTTSGSAVNLGISMAGPTEVLVDESDLDRARELLPPPVD